MRHAHFVFQRMLDQLEGRAKREHPVYCSRRRDFYIVVSGFSDFLAGRQISKTLRHLRERIVCLEKTARLRIDEGNTARHVGQDFFVEDNLPFDASLGFQLALVKPAAQPRDDGRKNDEPGRQHGHSCKKIVNRFVGQTLRLLHHRDPTGWLDRAE